MVATPESLDERQVVFEQGLAASRELGLIKEGLTIAARLDTYKVGVRVGEKTWVYGELSSQAETLTFLKKNPAWFAVDGVYLEASGTAQIFATATAPGTRLHVPSGGLLVRRLQSGLSFNTRMIGVENVVQTIAHEGGHHLHFSHDAKIYNREYLAIKRYRAR